MKTFNLNYENKINNIFHIADIHIPNDTDRHEEFIYVFNNLYKTIKSKCNKNSLIVICGDIIDKSGKISPNCINLCKSFLLNLSQICYTIIIPGNHDDNIRGNSTKIDSISSIIEGLNYKNLFYFKETGICHFNNITFYHLSVFDTEQDLGIFSLQNNKNNKNTKICLFHGMISSENQNFNDNFLKYQFKYSDFNNFDFVFLGDIHKHFYLNNKKTIAYPGSLIQLNYGEDIINHGGLLHWDINKKKSKFYNIENIYGFITIDMKDYDFTLPKFIPLKLKIRVNIYDSYIPYQKLVDILNNKFHKINKDIEITDIKPNYINNSSNNISINNFINNDNDLKLYLENEKKLDPNLINTILDIHKKELKNINSNLDTNKNIWNINYLEFENILGYTKKQTINFNFIRNKDKLCGIFGKNANGKSSLIAIILFSIYGSIPDINNNDIPNKYNRKLKTLIEFNLGNISYKIERTIRTVKLWKNDKNISEEHKNKTDENIKELLGDINIIKNTNISLQEQHNNIIYASNSEKLKILKKILGLDIYESIFNNIKDDIKNLETEYKILNQVVSDSKLILNSKNQVIKNIENYKQKLNNIHILYENHNYLIQYNQINNNLQNLKDSNTLLHQKINKIKIYNYFDELNKIVNEIIDLNKLIVPINNKYDLNKLQKKNKELQKLIDEINTNNINNNLPKFYENISEYNSDIHSINDKIINLNQKIINLDTNDDINKSEKDYKKLGKKLEKSEKEYQKYFDKQTDLSSQITKLNRKYNNYDKDIENKKINFKKYEKKINEYNDTINTNINLIQKYQTNIEKHKCNYNPNCKECNLNKKYNGISDLENNIQELKDDNINLGNKITKIKNKKNYNLKIEEEYLNYVDLQNNLNILNLDFEKNDINLDRTRNDIANINDKIIFLKKYIENYKNNSSILNQIDDLSIMKKDLNSKIEKTNNLIENFKKLDELNNQLQNNNLLIQNIQSNNKINTKITKLNKNKKELEDKIYINKQNEIELGNLKNNLGNNNSKISELEKELKDNKYDSSLEEYDNKIRDDIIKNLGINENKLEEINNIDIRDKLKKLEKLETNISNYKLYYNIINYKGYPFYLINKKRLVLQNEINKLLNTIVDFEIKLEIDNNNLIFYKNNNLGLIPIKNCSGFEKFIFSISLRIGLINISNFMKPNFIVIDEGFGNMDNTNIKKLNDVFDNIKNSFDLILIITHKEELKEKFHNIITVKNFKLEI